jgi:hypothetical protein
VRTDNFLLTLDAGANGGSIMLKVLFAASTILVAASSLSHAAMPTLDSPTVAKASHNFDLELKILADNDGSDNSGSGNSGSGNDDNDDSDDNDSNDDNDANSGSDTGNAGGTNDSKCDSPEDIAEHPECKS